MRSYVNVFGIQLGLPNWKPHPNLRGWSNKCWNRSKDAVELGNSVLCLLGVGYFTRRIHGSIRWVLVFLGCGFEKKKKTKKNKKNKKNTFWKRRISPGKRRIGSGKRRISPSTPVYLFLGKKLKGVFSNNRGNHRSSCMFNTWMTIPLGKCWIDWMFCLDI